MYLKYFNASHYACPPIPLPSHPSVSNIVFAIHWKSTLVLRVSGLANCPIVLFHSC